MRALIAETAYATLAESDRIFILLGFEQATPEAQNALLKLFEFKPLAPSSGLQHSNHPPCYKTVSPDV